MKVQPKPQTTHQVERAEDDDFEEKLIFRAKHMYPVSKPKAVPLTTQVKNGRCLTMEIDTGAAVKVISATTYKTMWGRLLHFLERVPPY